MPVIGLTDSIQPRYSRLGKLRKGGERPASGKAPGPDLDHFRFVSDNEDIMRAFVDAYGETPRLINVYLPHAAPADAFPTWAEIWGATGLVHRCDGQTMTIWQENGKYIRGSKQCSGGHKDNDYLRDAVGRLDLVIPELVMAGYVGYVTLETHGKHDIISILATLQAVSDDGRRDLRGVPFILRRIQESVSTPGFGKQAGSRSRVDKWMVKLEPAASWVQMQLGMATAAALPEGEDLPELETGIVDVTTGEILPDPAPEPAAAKPPAKPASSPRSVPNVKPAPKNGNGDIKTEINLMGEALWPGQWAEKKQKIADAHRLPNGEVDLPQVLKFLQARKESITDLTNLEDHVKKSWPGLEILPVMLVNELTSDKFDRFEFLAGVAKADAVRKRNKTVSEQDLVNVVLADLSEQSIPEIFR